MKLRMKGNSIRLRLTQPEVALLASGTAVEERTGFPGGGTLVWRLVSDHQATEPGAGFKDGVMIVWLPAAAVGRWARETVVGLEFASPLKSGGELSVLVEKDFACLRGGRDDEAEAYPNPRMADAADHCRAESNAHGRDTHAICYTNPVRGPSEQNSGLPKVFSG